ncbi:MAG: ThuA domain-containing protein [Verrucomicrobiales bacterium]|nr:ThuA domain-containing protein [Verrucomicrobiales bacterium]
MTLRLPLLLAVSLWLNHTSLAADQAPIRVVVWDEQQPQQRLAYSNFLGNEIATYLKLQPGLQVLSKRLADPDQGLGSAVLDACDVLIWWGHVRQKEISTATGQDIVRRIKAGRLNLIALHSAHWSTPFVEAMKERAREDALSALTASEREQAVLVETNRYANFFTPPKYDDFITPYAWYRKQPDGKVQITLATPNCCFPAYRPDAMPSQMRALLPDHPIAKGIPREFAVPQTEMYNEPFHVPPPDEVVFEERWQPGEWFRSGSVWKLGKGRVFYFRPGHEMYPVYKQPHCLQILDNAVRWLAGKESSQ